MEDYCSHLNELIKEEKPALIKAINENKYYLSQKENHDVGLQKAKEDFIANHLKTWATNFKDIYCNHVCIYEKDCSLED